ncbi:hypothetical protein [Lacinutrix salivirga]
MKNFINKKVLENTSFSVDTVGPLAYVVHKMSGAGSYQIEIYNNKSLLVSSEVECSDKFDKTSENVDLHQVLRNKSLHKIRLNNENGYLLFYNSNEFTNNRIVIKKGKNIEFDNQKPTKADMYAVNLLRPGVYKLKSKSLKSDITVDVEYPKLQESKESRFNESFKFSAENIKTVKTQKIQPNQGLVFNLGNGFEDFNIVMEKENVPKKGQSIKEQIKLEAQKIAKQKKQRANKNFHKKYQWTKN